MQKNEKISIYNCICLLIFTNICDKINESKRNTEGILC